MNYGVFRKTFGESFAKMRDTDRILNADSNKVDKCKEYIANFEILLPIISEFSPETWNYLEFIDPRYIDTTKENMCSQIIEVLSSQQNIREVLFFLTKFFSAFSSNLPDFNQQEFVTIILKCANSEDASISSLSLEVISILSKAQEGFKNAMFENEITGILLKTITSAETAQSTLHVLQSLGSFEGLNAFSESVLSYRELFTQDVLNELENFISKGNEEVFESYDAIFNINTDDTETLKALLHLLQHVLEDPLTTSYVNTEDFYAKMIELSANHNELNSDILSCIIYACFESHERVEKGIEAGIIDFISESIDNGSLQERVLGSVLITVMMLYADTIDTETILESGLILKVFSYYEDFESFFSFVLENIHKAIENELECEGRQIQNYINENEDVWKVLDEISNEGSECSILAQNILDEISPD